MKKIRKKALLSVFAAAIMCAGAMFASNVSAEGSRDLVKNGGYRPYLEYYTSKKTAGLVRINKINVFAKAGETLSFGSSVYSANVDGKVSGNDITVTYPDGVAVPFDVIDKGIGNINTVAKEAAGPHPDQGGYIPLTINVTQTGIYVFEFHSSFANKDGNPTRIKANEEFAGKQNNNTVAAWDVTVTDANGNEIPGRAYEYYTCLNTGENSARNEVTAMSDLYILTADGYKYRVGLNGIDPYGVVFFANNRGFVDNTSNTSLYKTIICNDNEFHLFKGNVSISTPSEVNTSTNVTHKIFFNEPADDLPESIPTVAQIPTQVKAAYFEGTDIGKSLEGEGGVFYTEFAKDTTYKLFIDVNKNGIEDDDDVVLANAAASGLNSIYWNGMDKKNQPVPAGDYDVYVSAKGGEYHFPLLDAENNVNGISVELLNAPYEYEGFDRFAIYYDDSPYITANGTSVKTRAKYSSNGIKCTESNYITPMNCLQGINSESGAMNYTNYYGDQKGLDFWSYFKGNDKIMEISIYPLQTDPQEDSPELHTDDTPVFVSGYVFFDQNKNGSFEPTEAPLANIGITITDEKGNVHEVETDRAGHYSAAISAGTYTVDVSDVPSSYLLTTHNDVQNGNVTSGMDYCASIGYYLGIDVSIDISTKDDVDTFNENDTAVFIIEVTNNSDIDARNVSASAALPAYAQFVSCDDKDYDGQTGVWNIGALEAGESRKARVTAKLLKAGDYNYPVTVSAEEDVDSSNSSAAVSYTVSDVSCTPETEDHSHTVRVNSVGSANGQVKGKDSMNTAMTYKLSIAPTHGSVTLNAATGEYVYTPEPGYTGTDSFAVLVTNAYGNSTVSDVSINIMGYEYKLPILTNDYAYIFGRDDYHMKADEVIFRGEACAVIYRLMKQNGKLGDFTYDVNAPVQFNDMLGRWDRSSIEYLTFRGAYTPNADKPFCASSPITRGEAFKIICLGLGFTDDAALSYDDYAGILVEAEYVQGFEDGSLRLDDTITRAQFCTIYNRITDRNGKKLVSVNGDEISAATYGFVDLEEDKWYYDAMIRATSSFDGEFVSLELRGVRNELDDYVE